MCQEELFRGREYKTPALLRKEAAAGVNIPYSHAFATESSKCNTQREESFIRGFPTEAFVGTAVDHVRHAAKMLPGQGVKIVVLGEEKAQQAVGVLIGHGLCGSAK